MRKFFEDLLCTCRKRSFEVLAYRSQQKGGKKKSAVFSLEEWMEAAKTVKSKDHGWHK